MGENVVFIFNREIWNLLFGYYDFDGYVCGVIVKEKSHLSLKTSDKCEEKRCVTFPNYHKSQQVIIALLNVIG